MLIVKSPVITEKSLQQATTGVYTFSVANTATKPEIAKMIAKLYSVVVKKVRVQSVIGQKVRRKTGIFKQSDWKKALVTLKSGQVIKAFELAEQKTVDHTDHTDHTGHNHDEPEVTVKKKN